MCIRDSHEFPAEDDHDHPHRHPGHRDEGNEGAHHQKLIGQGVHQLAEVGDEVSLAGNIAVQRIGDQYRQIAAGLYFIFTGDVYKRQSFNLTLALGRITISPG